MRRLQVWLVVSGALLLAGGAAAGFVMARVGGASGREASRGTTALLLPEMSAYWLLRSEAVWEEVGLEPEQRRRVDELLASHYAEDRRLRARLEGLAQETRSGLLEILSEEQRERLIDVQRRYESEHLEAETVQKIVQLRRDIGLTADQEAPVYQILYDTSFEKRQLFKELREKCDDRSREEIREEIRQKFDEIDEERLARLAEYLDPEQMAAYRKILEERRQWWEKRRKKHRGPPRDRKRSGDEGEKEGC